MAHGEVIFVSKSQNMIVVHHNDGFAVVELLGSEGNLSVGDAVVGDWSALGREEFQAHGENHDAYFQGNWGTRQVAIDTARRTGGG